MSKLSIQNIKSLAQNGVNTLKSKAQGGVEYVKKYWNKPAPGDSLPLKEFVSYCFGSMGICGFTFICGETVTFASGYFCGSIMGISLMDFSIISIIAVVVKYLILYLEPFTMTIFENLGKVPKKTGIMALIANLATIALGVGLYFVPSAPFEVIIKGLPQIVANILVITGAGNLVNWLVRSKLCSKFGRYKPFLMIYGVPVAIISSLIPFIPASMDYTTKLVLLHFVFTLRGRFTALYSDNSHNIVAVMTPNTVERQKLYSIGGIFLGFLRSIFRIIFPLMIISTGGYLDPLSYKVFIPVLSVISLGLGFGLISVKERVMENKAKAPKVKFFKSAKTLMKNKYFWVNNIAGMFASWNSLANGVMNYLLIYELRMEWISGLLTVIGVSSVVGNLLTPYLIKRFEKRTIVLVLRAVWTAVTVGYILAIMLDGVPSLLLLMLFIFIRSAVSSCCDGVTRGMNADILDYHQWKTGERADNMSTIFAWFTTPFITIAGLIVPMVLAKFGFTSDWDVMYDSAIFDKVVYAYIIFTAVGLVLSTLPYILYDLNKKKLDTCVEEIRARLKSEIEGDTEDPEQAAASTVSGIEALAQEVVGTEGSEQEAQNAEA